MSIRDLFGKTSSKLLVSTSLASASLDVESADYVVTELEERNIYRPIVDYTDPANFAFYGSAKKYYTDAINSIARKYPYDGSAFEKVKWKKDASELAYYIFENEYPGNNGYINVGYSYGASSSNSTDNYAQPVSSEYIAFKGGPNTAPEQETFKLSSLFGTSNVVKASDTRESNLLLDGTEGATVEFWLLKPNSSGSKKQVIFDLWNNEATGSTHGRFRIEIHPGVSGEESQIYIDLVSGSTGATAVALGSGLTLTGSTWQHFAVTAINSGSNIEFKLLKNGVVNDSSITGSAISRVNGPMLGFIGALGAAVSGGNAALGYGKLSGSLDEFRYWKTKRTEKEISRHWFSQVNGGSNTDTSNTSLGVYFKFNEGIFNSGSTDTRYDNKVLDYSGRISNGVWTGYTLGSRVTGSAMVLASAATSETLDPVVYITHPDVVALIAEKDSVGVLHDNNNNSQIFNTIPTWIVDADADNESDKLLELTQIMGSYFDEIFLKIKHLPALKEAVYRNGRPLPYALKLLESVGFTTQDIFTNSTVLENLGNRTEENLYDQKLFDVKNHIYQNIYNNLSYIQKSKGTEKSIRNLLRCFGVDDELVKLNIYSNDSVYTFKDRYIDTYIKKKLINFNDPDRFQGTVYQMTSSLDASSVSYISGGSDLKHYGSTLEAEVVFPVKYEQSDKNYFATSFLTSSLFGMHAALTSSVTDTTWASGDSANISVYAIKPSFDSKDAYLHVTSSNFGISLTSSLIPDIYSNQKWNMAVRIKHEKYPNSGRVLGATTGDYVFEFYATNATQDNIDNEITLTASIGQTLGEAHFSAAKRIYAGAHRQDFTGSVLKESDIKLSDVKYWLSYVEDSIIKERAKNPTLFGQKSPSANLETVLSSSVVLIPQDKTLALHWDFNLVTGSDSGHSAGPSNSYDAQFNILDASSGSNSSDYGTIGTISSQKYTGVGDYFFRDNTEMVENSYISIARHRLPENIASSDLVEILTEDDEIFTRDSAPINHFFALEKSMYQTISDEMIKFFGTVTDFNNLIGRPHFRYENEYRALITLREMFFERVTNNTDLEKYVDYFKWIDSAVTKMVYQLVPASADFSADISNVVESHILERNKYRWKLPSVELAAEAPISSVNTIGELKYKWKTGHAPINGLQSTNCVWWKERSERPAISDGIFQALSSAYTRKLTTVLDLDVNIQKIVNKNPSNLDVIKPITKYGTGEYLQIDIAEIIAEPDCDD